MKFLFFIAVVFVAFDFVCNAQNETATLKIVEGEKDVYFVSDTLTFKASVVMPSDVCADGMNKSKVFLSGFKMLKEGCWKKEKGIVWTNEFQVSVIENNKKTSKITLMRKSDLGSFFTQFKLDIDR